MKQFRLYIFGLLALALASCSTFGLEEDAYDVTEATKNLSGDWVISTVTRNSIDITDRVDFTKFVLHLKEDGTYKIDNYLPFVTKNEGKWTTDDPQYPFRIFFEESGKEGQSEVEFNYPSVDGIRSLQVKLSPGCGSNSYVYTMQKK